MLRVARLPGLETDSAASLNEIKYAENEISHHFGFEKGIRELREGFVKGVQGKMYFWLWFGAQFSLIGSFLFYMKNIL